MCGIMGYYSFGRTTPNKNKIEKMFVLLESRGRDASGFAYINNQNKLVVSKAAVKSSDFVKESDWKSLVLPKIMILHTRAKTQGEPTNNMNNHPLFTKDGLCIVHNGMIFNDKEIFGKKEKRDAEVDSEAILAVLAAKGKKTNESVEDKIKHVFDKLEGGFAVASININEPSELVLFRKDNPIELYYDSSDDILYFCSERRIMLEALGISKSSKRGFNLGENSYHHYELENNHALIINTDGVETYKKYFPKRESWHYRNNYSLDDYDFVECPYCYSVTEYDEGKLFNRCSYCGQVLNEEDIYV